MAKNQTRPPDQKPVTLGYSTAKPIDRQEWNSPDHHVKARKMTLEIEKQIRYLEMEDFSKEQRIRFCEAVALCVSEMKSTCPISTDTKL